LVDPVRVSEESPVSSSAPFEHHYSAADSPRGFLYHAVRALSLPRRAFEHSVLFRHFFGSELRGRFQGTMLGPVWVLVHPLFLFVVYFLVFGVGLRNNDGDGGIAFFAVYLFSGIVCFHALVSGTSSAMNAIVGNSNLVKKVAFPCELLPVVSPAVETVVLMVGLGVAILAGWLSGAASPGLGLLALPLFALVLSMIGTGLGLLLAHLNVFVRDVRQLYGILTTPWLFMSPNFWTPKVFFDSPEKLWAETVSMVLNPAYCLLLAARQIVGLDEATIGIHTTLGFNLAVAAAWGGVLLAIGYGAFMSNKHKYADLV
jgi:lipopolysaccharide transport system permease protein